MVSLLPQRPANPPLGKVDLTMEHDLIREFAAEEERERQEAATAETQRGILRICGVPL